MSSPFIRRPLAEFNQAEFENLAQEIFANPGGWIDYKLEAPKWSFLCYLTDHKGVLAHGSGSDTIDEFEPRQSNDVTEFGDRKAVYASSDALWAMYFAVVNRDGPVKGLVNSCYSLIDSDDPGPFYFFSINKDAFEAQPWRSGVVYLLPGDSFERQPDVEKARGNVRMAHYRSFEPVRPLAKMRIDPEDFPFLDHVRGHDPVELMERYKANPDGFPWCD